MSMLIEKFRAGAVDNRNYNCAEKVLNLGNEELGLGMSEDATRVAAGFGAGMGREHLCGAIAGAVMVLSLRRVKTVAKESAIYQETAVLLDNIERQLGSLLCQQLKADHYDSEKKCQFIIDQVIEILDKQLIESSE